jgi:hypothetical protein
MRCITCGFSVAATGQVGSRLVRIRADAESPVVELCEICSAVAGGPTTL